MGTTLLDHSRQRLLAQRQQIVKRLFEVEADLSTLTAEHEIERTDQVQLDVPEEVLAKLDDQSRREVEEIDDALARIDAGTYGRCITCGHLIPGARLEVMPTAQRCMPCQARVERQGKG